MIKSGFNIFNVDNYRHQLAVSNSLEELEKTYCEQYPEFKQVNLSKKWDQHALYNETSKNPITIERIKQTSKLVNSSSKILDFGVGYGDIIENLLKINSKLKFTGLDISIQFIDNLKIKYPNLNFYQKELMKIENNFYETILVLEVMEHITPSKTLSILKKINKILMNNGELILSVPLYENLKETTYQCSKCGHQDNTNGHVRSYTPELIKAELKMSGFKILKEVYINYPTGFVGFLFKIARFLLGKKTFPSNIIIKCQKE